MPAAVTSELAGPKSTWYKLCPWL